MSGVRTSLGVEAGGCVCKGRLLFGSGPCWPLWALRESVLLERAHEVAAERRWSLQMPININADMLEPMIATQFKGLCAYGKHDVLH